MAKNKTQSDDIADYYGGMTGMEESRNLHVYQSSVQHILDIASELSAAITSSDVYKSYIDRKALIDANPDLRARIQIFKRAQFDYQSKTLQSLQPSFDEEKYVSKLYADLTLNEDARLFLESEKEILQTLRDVHETIQSCNIDTFL